MTAFLALVQKDLLLYLNNRRAVLLSVLAPIVIAAFFGSLFGSSEPKPARIPVAVTDLDGSELSAAVVAALRADEAFQLQELPEQEAQAQVRAGRLRAAITLPAGFGAQAPRALFGAGPRPALTLTYDPSQAMVLPLVRGLLAQHLMRPVSEAAFSAQSGTWRDLRSQIEAGSDLPAPQREDLLALLRSVERVQAHGGTGPAAAASAPPGGDVGALRLPFDTHEVQAVSERAGPGTGYNSYAQSFAGMGVQFLLLLGVDMGVGLLLMRRQGLWLRLRAAPLSRTQLLGSHVASAALISLGVFAVVYLVAITVFGVRVLGHPLGFAAVLLGFALFTASFGLMIAAVGGSPEATRGLAILVTLLLVMLGGAWIPAFLFPTWLQSLVAWVPTYWAIEGLAGTTWRGWGLAQALRPAGLLLAASAVMLLLAVWRFRWEE